MKQPIAALTGAAECATLLPTLLAQTFLLRYDKSRAIQWPALILSASLFALRRVL